MDIGKIFLDILTVISDTITTLLGMLPNPDPFPAIINNLRIEASNPFAIACFWLDQFLDLSLIISFLEAFFSMFAIGWIILMLWKWLKAR